MNPIRPRSRLGTLMSGAMLAAACVSSTGCQVDVAGQTLPSAAYLDDDIQYFPAGPEFKLSNEAAAMKAYQAEAAGVDTGEPQP